MDSSDKFNDLFPTVTNRQAMENEKSTSDGSSPVPGTDVEIPRVRSGKIPHDLDHISLIPMKTDKEFAIAMSRLSGGITLEEAIFLSTKASEVKSGCIVEVGSFKGKSSVALSHGARQCVQDVTVYCIEPHAPFQGVFGGKFGPQNRGEYYQAMLATGSYMNTALLNISSEAISEQWAKPIAVCFIDGDHRYEGVKRDWECWSKHIAVGGCVIFDDALKTESGPAQLVREILTKSTYWEKLGAPGKFVALRRVATISSGRDALPGGKKILVACEKMEVAGGLLRFDRLAKVIKPLGHRLAIASLAGDIEHKLFNNAELLSIDEAKKQSWDVVMIPGAGFSEETINQFKMFRDPQYGLRVQHILNDQTKKEKFLAVNRAFVPDIVVFNNKWPAGSYTSFCGKQFHVLEGAVDINFFTPPSKRRNTAIQNQFIVGGLANKNATPLITAMEMLPDNMCLVLFGDVPENIHNAGERLQYSGRLKYLGVLNDEDLLAFYRSLSVVVSTENFAGWSNMTAEAAASGVPIICTQAGTASFAKEGKTAIILKTPDAESIARAIRNVSEHANAAAERADAARKEIEEYSWEKYAYSLMELIEKKPESHYYQAPERGLYGKWPLDIRFRGLDKCFRSCAGKSVLDLGAAEGFVSLQCLRYGAKDVTGFEIDANRVESAKKLLASEGFKENVAFYTGNISNWETFVASCGDRLKEFYDVVFYLGVHHHLGENRISALKGALKRARELFVVRTPASFWERDEIMTVICRENWEPIDTVTKKEGEDYLGDLVVFKKKNVLLEKNVACNKKNISRMFVSYPKSGRTWIRYALIKAGIPETITFHHDGFEYNDGSKPTLNFDINQRMDRYKYIDRIIYLERDPRDVICSLYYQITGRFKDFFNYQGTISDFLRDSYFGAHNLQGFRQMWAELQERREVLKVTYEEMTESPAALLSKIIQFYEFNVDALTIQRAVKESSFDNMKAIEQSKTFEHPWLRPRNEAPKVRSGKVGGYLNELNEQDIEFLNTMFGF